MSKEKIYNLIEDYHKRTISEKNLRLLQKWSKESRANKEEFISHLTLLKQMNTAIGLVSIRKDLAWDKIQSKIQKPKARKITLWLPYAAAAVIVFAVSTLLLTVNTQDVRMTACDFDKISKVGSKQAVLTLNSGRQINLNDSISESIFENDHTEISKDSNNLLSYKKNLKNTKTIYNHIQVPRGGAYNLVLSDGTRVWLNSESSLKFPVQFSEKIRKVELSGEAYFEVSHNTAAPFFVKACDTEIKVLGTKFNISAYEESMSILTTLVSGSVEVNCLGNKKKLVPGYQSIVIKGRNDIEIKQVDTDSYTSWINGVFEFNNASLEQITNQLSRWYNVDFFFYEPRFRNFHFTGAAQKDKPIEFILEIIEDLAQVKFKVQDNKIIIENP